MAETKIEPEVKSRPLRIPYVPGVPLTEKDIEHLYSERDDALLMEEFKKHSKDGNVKQFVEEHILKQYQENGKEKLPAMVFKHNVRARSIPGYIKAFEENEKLRVHVRSNNVKAYHHIISFSKLDNGHINEAMLKDIAQQFISLRGSNSLFCGAVHQDRQHYHIHLVQSGTQYMTGLANRMSRQQFQELKIAMQDYQKEKYPELVNSIVNHQSRTNKTKNMDREKNITDEREGNKKALIEFLTTTFQRAASKEAFLDELVRQDYKPYYRNGKLQGIVGDRKYRFSTLGFKEQVEGLDRQSAPKKEPDALKKYLRTLPDEHEAVKGYAKTLEADREMIEKVQREIDEKRAREERQLKELQDLRSGKRTRSHELDIGKKPEKVVSFSEATRGKSDEEVREMQQEMLDRNMQFEKEHGIERDGSSPGQTPDASSGMIKFNYDNLCDDCKKEREDETYDNPKFYSYGEFDTDKYQEHMAEEFGKTITDEYLESLNGHEVMTAYYSDWRDKDYDNNLKETPLRDDDSELEDDRDDGKEDERERDDDDLDLER